MHVRGAAQDGLVRAGGAGAFADFDDGRAPLTVEQIAAQPNGDRWDETVLTYRLGPRGFASQEVRRRSVSGPAASMRRCTIVR